MGNNWNVDSWRNKVGLQMPTYTDEKELNEVLTELKSLPPLAFAGEVRSLRADLAKVAHGKAFLLQGGDCAESFKEFSAEYVKGTVSLIFKMAVVLMYGTGLPVVKVGRLAGQFSKPRSSDTETQNGVELPSYRGDIINSVPFSAEARKNDPQRMLRAYNQSAQCMNLMRAFCTGGFADIHNIHKWNSSFVDGQNNERYRDLVNDIDRGIKFMDSMGLNSSTSSNLAVTTLYTSHEALLLPYEEALTRKDTITSEGKDWVNTSAHMLWIGERTRQLDGSHLEFMRGIINPIGCKISDTMTPEDLITLIDILNPDNIPGKLTLITRFGANKIEDYLPALVEKVKTEGRHVIWSCDPMHGNTESASGYKTRKFENIVKEIASFVKVHKEKGTHPGGIHLEMTGANVTECVGGSYQVTEGELSDRYHTHCDPRLNHNQALEIAFWLAEAFNS